MDHKPLVAVMGNRPLELIKNPRLMSLKDKTLIYKFKCVHIPGNIHTGPDVASRYPGGPPMFNKTVGLTALARATSMQTGTVAPDLEEVAPGITEGVRCAAAAS